MNDTSTGPKDQGTKDGAQDEEASSRFSQQDVQEEVNGSTRPGTVGLIAGIRRFFGLDNDGPSLRESLEEVLEEHDGGNSRMTSEERTMFNNLLSLGELRVDDVMVPRTDIVSVDVSMDLPSVLKFFKEQPHSRLPVYKENLDEPIGLVHIRDLITYAAERGQNASDEKSEFSLMKLRREILFVPPSMPVVELLARMRHSRIHMALVIDEYGGTDGLVTIEDVVEEIVGDIEDEHDNEETPKIIRRSDGGFHADARVELEEFENLVGLDLLPDDQDDYIDTLGGLVFSLAGRVPQRGELIEHPAGLEFEVAEADPRRIKRLIIRQPGKTKKSRKNRSVHTAEKAVTPQPDKTMIN